MAIMARIFNIFLSSFAMIFAVQPAPGQDTAPKRSRRTPITEVFESTRDAVVNISTTKFVRVRSSLSFDRFFGDAFFLPDLGTRSQVQKRTSVGSGFLIHRDGYVVTNAHVVHRTAEQKVILADKTEYDAKLITTDREHDLAILKINADRDLPHLRLGRSDDLMIGETVIAIGNALGYQHSLTTGVLSSIGRELQFGDDLVYKNLLQTDAAINPGNSGGPLMNINGELIGINSAIRGDAQNVGFAIPVNALMDLLPEMLVEGWKRVRLGLDVRGRDVAEVTSVAPGSEADRAGILPDDLIIAIDRSPVRSFVDFYVAISERPTGQPMQFDVDRDGKRKRFDLVIKSISAEEGTAQAARRMGLRFRPLKPAEGTVVQLEPGVGLYVEGVAERGPSFGVIDVGDILVQMDRYTLHNMTEIGQILAEIPADDEVYVKIIRITGQYYDFLHGNLKLR
jgi:serine protease Do